MYDVVAYYKEMNDHYFRANCYHTVRDPQHDATSGNHHVSNATHHVILNKLTKGYSIVLQSLIKDEAFSAVEFIEATRNKHGWFDRHPKKLGDRQAHDDNMGIIVSSKILGLPFGKDIYDHGNKWTKGTLAVKGYKIPLALKWYYTNLDDLPAIRLNAWHGRFVWLNAVYDVGGGKKPGVLASLAYAGYLLKDIYFNKDKTDTSGKILKWLANDAMKGQNFLIDYAIRKWEQYIKDMYVDGHMGEVLGVYHGFDHPFSKSMWKRM